MSTSVSCTMPTYKLMYFNARGLSEPIRWIFAQAGQEYEDYRFKDGEWTNLKANTPLGLSPVLEVDGKQLSQSKTIARYLANQFGLAGKNEFDKAKADMLVDYMDDVRAPVYAMYNEQDEEKKKKLREKFGKEQLPGFLANYEKNLKENNGGDGFFVGEGLTWADISFVAGMEGLMKAGEAYGVPANIIDNYDKLKALISRVEGLPAIAKWIKERPVTEH